jgi:hypothetical protein
MRPDSETLLATDEYKKFRAGCGFRPGGMLGEPDCCSVWPLKDWFD